MICDFMIYIPRTYLDEFSTMNKGLIPALKKITMNVKKRRQQMPMPTDIQDYFFNSEAASSYEKAQENFPLEQNQSIKNVSGKYERYYLDEDRKLITKDLVSIGSDGKVIVRSFNGIYKGTGTYFMNSTLSINLTSINDSEAFCAQLLSYVGRFTYDDIQCLYTICSTIDGHNVPLARIEVLVPADTFGVLPEQIKLDSQGFYKLNYKYPHLYKILQARQLRSQGRVTWP